MNEPRNQCRSFFDGREIKSYSCVPKPEFDKYDSQAQFSEGPFRDTFGDGRHEPYNPHRQAFGVLKDGKGVFCELRDVVDNTDEVKADEAVTESQE